MKRVIYVIAILAALTFCVWLALRPPPQKPSQNVPLQAPLKPTSAASPPSASNAPPTNAFIRPDSIDETTRNRITVNRQVILSEDQPIKFYTRVLDQNEQAVEGAKLTVSVERLDETMFEPTNYLHWDPAAAYQKKFFDLYSDVQGWIQFTNITGRALRIEALVKDGYSWTLPQIGSFGYEPEGKHLIGDAGMEGAFDSSKGYILHLQKTEETNAMNSAR